MPRGLGLLEEQALVRVSSLRCNKAPTARPPVVVHPLVIKGSPIAANQRRVVSGGPAVLLRT